MRIQQMSIVRRNVKHEDLIQKGQAAAYELKYFLTQVAPKSHNGEVAFFTYKLKVHFMIFLKINFS
jgi:hypothetical protein